jgi:hypothetical protein
MNGFAVVHNYLKLPCFCKPFGSFLMDWFNALNSCVPGTNSRRVYAPIIIFQIVRDPTTIKG